MSAQFFLNNPGANPEPSQAELQHLHQLVHQGDLQQALIAVNMKLTQFPRSLALHRLAGHLSGDLGQIDAMIEHFKRVVELEPADAEACFKTGLAYQIKGQHAAAIEFYEKALENQPDAPVIHNNLGMAHHACGDLSAAISSFRKAVKCRKDFAEAHKNLGAALNDDGERKAAVESLEKAIRLKPDYGQAFNDLGLAYKEQGKPEAALENYIKALEVNPDDLTCQMNVVEVLPEIGGSAEHSHPIVEADLKIREASLATDPSTGLSDGDVCAFLEECSGVVESYGVDFEYGWTQAFKKNALDPRCDRHMEIFNEHNVVPEHCFGCYKVVTSPASVIDLVKLFFVFDDLDLENDNIRKCMVEVRADVSGAFKGFIYSSSLDEAEEVRGLLDTQISATIDPELVSKIKRGCSEYAVSFPGFDEVTKDQPSRVTYDESWRHVERAYDRAHPSRRRAAMNPTQTGIGLRDFLVMRNWISYAHGIDDPSVEVIGDAVPISQQIFDEARARA